MVPPLASEDHYPLPDREPVMRGHMSQYLERRLALWQTVRLNGLMTRKAMVLSSRKMVMTYLFIILPSLCLDSKH